MRFVAHLSNLTLISMLYAVRSFFKLMPLLVVLMFSSQLFAQPLSDKLEGVLKKTPSEIQMCVFDIDRQSMVYNYAANTPIKPASVQKLLLTAAALDILGPEFRFNTGVFAKGRSGSFVKSLYIVGGGDPSMTIERLWLLAREIKAHGIRQIEELVLDDSSFEEDRTRKGQRAYMTGSSALAFNFNSIGIKACPTDSAFAAVTAEPWESGAIVQGRVRSVMRGESKIAVEAKSSIDLSFVVSGSVSHEDGCAILFRSVPNPAQYFADTLKAYLNYIGVTIAKKVSFNEVPDSAERVASFPGEPLRDIIKGMNQYSNNFTAEQILYAIGGREVRDRTYYSRELGLEKLREYANNIGKFKGLNVVDASGLSHENRVPALLFCTLISKFATDKRFDSEFVSSLAVSTRNGTLREREFGEGLGVVVRGKTGTLDGVSSIAGIAPTKSGLNYAFTIIQNNKLSKPDAAKVEDRLVRILIDE